MIEYVHLGALIITVGTLLWKGGKLVSRAEAAVAQLELYPPAMQDRRLTDLEAAVYDRRSHHTNGLHHNEQ